MIYLYQHDSVYLPFSPIRIGLYQGRLTFDTLKRQERLQEKTKSAVPGTRDPSCNMLQITACVRTPPRAATGLTASQLDPGVALVRVIHYWL